MVHPVHAKPVLVDDDPVIRFVCRESKARWHPGRFVVIGLGELKVVIAGFDGVPVEFGLDLGGVLGHKVVG